MGKVTGSRVDELETLETLKLLWNYMQDEKRSKIVSKK
jgi:hypothetical protein